MFSYYFCLVIEGSGSGAVSLTTGAGSRRPRNIQSQRIRIRMLIRIRNTGLKNGIPFFFFLSQICLLGSRSTFTVIQVPYRSSLDPKHYLKYLKKLFSRCRIRTHCRRTTGSASGTKRAGQRAREPPPGQRANPQVANDIYIQTG